jgi:hypothetical protein
MTSFYGVDPSQYSDPLAPRRARPLVTGGLTPGNANGPRPDVTSGQGLQGSGGIGQPRPTLGQPVGADFGITSQPGRNSQGFSYAELAGGGGGSGFGQPTVPTRPNVPGAGVSAINPGVNDFRGQQITPTASNQFANAQRGAQRAGSQYGGAVGGALGQTGFRDGSMVTVNPTMTSAMAQQAFNASGGSAVNYGADTRNIRGLVSRGTESLYDTPDRVQLASDAFKLFQDESNPQFEMDMRNVGKKNAAIGRVGSGMATQDLGTVQQRRDESFANEARRLAGESAGQTMDDRLKRLAGTTGSFESLAGNDLATARDSRELAASNREQMRLGASLADQAFGQEDTNRRFSLGADQASNDLMFDRVGAGRGYFNDLTGYESQLYGQDRGYRDELRGERGYQDDLAREARGDARNQRFDEEDLLDRSFDRQQRWGDQLSGIGFQGNPWDSAERQGTRNQEAGQSGGYGDMMGQWLMYEQMRRQPQTSTRP